MPRNLTELSQIEELNDPKIMIKKLIVPMKNWTKAGIKNKERFQEIQEVKGAHMRVYDVCSFGSV